MPLVSKRILPKGVEEKISETLLEAVSQVKDRGEVSAFINDLLSPVERLMVGKRLAIAVLLIKGLDYESIKDLLKVSNATVAKVSVILKLNMGYRLAVEKIAKTEAGRLFWQDLARFVHRLGTPSDTFADEDMLNRKFGLKKRTIL